MPAPRATYRLQLHPRFTFADAAAAVPYLAELGISHLYLSPVLQAAPGSTHGYDIVDPDRVNRELGGEDGFRALVAAAHAAGLGILLDIVPNHMSIGGTANRWWVDVLENGAASYYAHYFDVDWNGGDERVLLPVLGERYGHALNSGGLQLARGRGPEAAGRGSDLIEVRAGELRFPMSPHALGRIVRRAGERIAHPELQFIGDALAGLPGSAEVGARRRRHRDRAVLLARLTELGDRVARAIDDEIAAVNADPFELDAILEAQNYRLAHWSVAGSQLSYRRFFDINSLVGIRVELPDVFAAGHHRIFGWVADGTVDGLRVDHVDGLRDPAGYLVRLGEAWADAPGSPPGSPWILVEKILASDEQLPASWPVAGTTGYEAMNRLAALLVDPDGEPALTEAFTAYTGQPWDPVGESRRARLEVLSDALHSELARLTELAVRACGASPACRDYTRAEIEAALAELLAGYPTYRTYLGDPISDPRDATRGGGNRPALPGERGRESPLLIDRGRIAHAARAALAARPELDRDLVGFLEAALAFELTSAEATELARAAQQVSGPVVAKGDEDTLLYRQVRLLARCEVGTDLARFALDPDQAHVELATGLPHALLATSTHDSKRGEDVRARLAVLSELPDAWRAAVLRWRARAEAGWGDVAPDRVFEYVMWQTLVGAWPIAEDRAQQFAEKATREARLRTSWRRPDAAYEAARTRWLAAVYADAELVGELAAFAAELSAAGDRNSLAQLLIKLTAPGVPDFYQGSELRDDALVDPDNRRPVDLAARARRLRELVSAGDGAGARLGGDLGAIKLWTIHRVLALRGRAPDVLAGPYRALAASGTHARRVFAFTRGDDLVTVVPRLGVRASGWSDTALALGAGTWRDVLTDHEVAGGVQPVAALWRRLPIALLLRVRP
ncbi:MAG TPA: malto-oligosyltrehalose synthase [Kofleriaceae bacterium]|jgi:(1->4)-alpha-D-glucan 1-alpha-D-glucosylmutase|nr:malto-oligosyltrehalose synthase [Kofleriaceae bacterium]